MRDTCAVCGLQPFAAGRKGLHFIHRASVRSRDLHALTCHAHHKTWLSCATQPALLGTHALRLHPLPPRQPNLWTKVEVKSLQPPRRHGHSSSVIDTTFVLFGGRILVPGVGASRGSAGDCGGVADATLALPPLLAVCVFFPPRPLTSRRSARQAKARATTRGFSTRAPSSGARCPRTAPPRPRGRTTSWYPLAAHAAAASLCAAAVVLFTADQSSSRATTGGNWRQAVWPQRLSAQTVGRRLWGLVFKPRPLRRHVGLVTARCPGHRGESCALVGHVCSSCAAQRRCPLTFACSAATMSSGGTRSQSTAPSNRPDAPARPAPPSARTRCVCASCLHGYTPPIPG